MGEQLRFPRYEQAKTLGILSFRKGKKGDSDDSPQKDKAVQREPRKAKPWFQRAEDVSATNHDYAIECFINGFKHDPDNMNMHEALREVSLKRKVAGGKPAGFMEGMKSGGSHPVDKMIHAERMLAMDPMNAKAARDVMKYALAAESVEPDFNMNEVALWVGQLAVELNSQSKKPDKAMFKELCELFRRIPDYENAIKAARQALNMSPDDSDYMSYLKDLEAEAYSYAQRGGDQEGEIDFRKNIKNSDEQSAIQQDEAVTRTERMVNETIERRRSEYEEDPTDPDRVTKLVDALLKKPGKEPEDEAIALLKKIQEQTGQYRYKVRYTDIQMRQMKNIVKNLRDQMNAVTDPDEKAKAKANYEEALRRQLQFELKEFKERVDNYPTDMALRFEYGRRLFATGYNDEAISQFQQAKSDPKHRSQAHWYLAQCYLKQDWHEEAISTVRSGIELHPTPDDTLGLELRYLLMDALSRLAEMKNNVEMAQEAQKVASGILQTNINFKDIKDRMNQVRGLVDQLQQSANA